MLLNELLSLLTVTADLLQISNHFLIVRLYFMLPLQQLSLTPLSHFPLHFQSLNLVEDLISVFDAITYLLTLEFQLLVFDPKFSYLVFGVGDAGVKFIFAGSLDRSSSFL
jgi:hypothetical protein